MEPEVTLTVSIRATTESSSEPDESNSDFHIGSIKGGDIFRRAVFYVVGSVTDTYLDGE
jgi:hypothetical protein